jgi:hypothetical protein
MYTICSLHSFGRQNIDCSKRLPAHCSTSTAVQSPKEYFLKPIALINAALSIVKYNQRETLSYISV